tara:strand:- start:10126 stop:10848 length:723 start_codon:yes stop_codon:yes gene_type:complete
MKKKSKKELVVEKYGIKKKVLIELLALEPDMPVSYYAEKLGVDRKTVTRWRMEPGVIDKIYERYMELGGNELPNVLNAMIREAKRGNVQAGNLVLKHWGKLQDVVVHKIEAPFMQFQRMQESNVDIVDAEIVEEGQIKEALAEIQDDILSLPDRDERNNDLPGRSKEEKREIKATFKEEQYKESQRVRKQWRQRAKKVGVSPLPAGNPKNGAYERWQKKVIDAEKVKKVKALLGNQNQEE